MYSTIFLFILVVFLPLNVYVEENTKNSSAFKVSDQVLIDTWKNRSDLQKVYPEVKDGNLSGLKIWAENYGWNEEPTLEPLTPTGKVPMYKDPWRMFKLIYIPNEAGNIKYLPFIVIVVSLGIGIFVTLSIISIYKLHQR